MASVRKTLDLTNACIDALNDLHGTPTRACVAGPAAAPARVAEVLRYIQTCSQQYIDAASTDSRGVSDMEDIWDYETTGGTEMGTHLNAALLSLPEEGGTFDIAQFLSPELAAYLDAGPEALADPLVAAAAASRLRSCQMATSSEYAATIARLYKARMAVFSAQKAKFPLGLFAITKSNGSLRLIVDGRPGNMFFLDLPIEHTGGDAFAVMVVDEGHTLLASKVDLADYFHTILARAGARPYFGLRPIRAELLAMKFGIEVSPELVDADGWTHPQLATCPMGWKPAPALAQAGNESVLYGAEGSGSELARALPPVVRPTERLSSTRTPELASGADLRCHSIIIDDLINFKTVPTTQAHLPAGATLSADVAAVCQRYEDVGARVRMEKVADYSARQVVAGYQLDSNVLRAPAAKYSDLSHRVRTLCRRGFARPREVEGIVGVFTHLFLLHRFALSTFSATYAFARKLGMRHARLWPAVAQELLRALALLPLVRAELDRPVAPVLLQTDASNSGFGVVYTDAVPAADLRFEVQRPRSAPASELTPWNVEDALGAAFLPPSEPAQYRIAARGLFQGKVRDAHINTKELASVLTGVRWASRAPRTRRCRLVLQSDSSVVVSAMRKGRSSKPGLLSRLRRLAAITLAERITLVARHVPTDRNMADAPSRGGLVPGPCIPERALVARPRGRGLGYAAQRVGEASNPGPPPIFWSPLLTGRAGQTTVQSRYRPAVTAFIEFVRAHGDPVDCAADCEYWLAYYMHIMYTTGAATKSHCACALYGIEFFMPEAKPLKLPRACLKGWNKLVPPTPYAPMPKDLVDALALVCALAGDVAVGLAILLSFDCLLRISEVAGLRVGDIVDHRQQADVVGRGVAVYLRVTKTGRRQAVQIEDPHVAALLVAWQAAVARHSPLGPLFPTVATLRSTFNRALDALGDDTWETRGLRFVWHSLRHGGASRAYLRGGAVVLPDLLVRGRWAVESSGRHYIQSGRQLLLSMSLPASVAALARALRTIGVGALVEPDLRERVLAAS